MYNSDVQRVVTAFELGLELAKSIHDKTYSDIEVDDLGSLIGALICQRVIRLEKVDA